MTSYIWWECVTDWEMANWSRASWERRQAGCSRRSRSTCSTPRTKRSCCWRSKARIKIWIMPRKILLQPSIRWKSLFQKRSSPNVLNIQIDLKQLEKGDVAAFKVDNKQVIWLMWYFIWWCTICFLTWTDERGENCSGLLGRGVRYGGEYFGETFWFMNDVLAVSFSTTLFCLNKVQHVLISACALKTLIYSFEN